MYHLLLLSLPVFGVADASCETSVCHAVGSNEEAILASRQELGCCSHGWCAPGAASPACSQQLVSKMQPCLQIKFEGKREKCIQQAVAPGTCVNLAEECEVLRSMSNHLQLTSSILGCAMREGMAWWTPFLAPSATLASFWPFLIPPFISQQASVNFQLSSATAATGVALIGGLNHREGNVYVKDVQGNWGAVCGNGFDAADANVVCQQAGFRQAIAGRIFKDSRFGDLPFGHRYVLDNVRCTGMEADILSCRFDTAISGNCQFNTIAGIECA